MHMHVGGLGVAKQQLEGTADVLAKVEDRIACGSVDDLGHEALVGHHRKAQALVQVGRRGLCLIGRQQRCRHGRQREQRGIHALAVVDV